MCVFACMCVCACVCVSVCMCMNMYMHECMHMHAEDIFHHTSFQLCLTLPFLIAAYHFHVFTPMATRLQTLTQALWRTCGALDQSSVASSARETTVLPTVWLKLAIGAWDTGVAGGIQETAWITGHWKHSTIVNFIQKASLQYLFETQNC